MGEWRHFGGRLEPTAAPLDCGMVPEPCPSGFREAPEAAIRGDLTRIIEGEILPRLMLAHRAGGEPVAFPGARRPSRDQIARFSALLLDPGADDATTDVLALLDEGLSLDSLLLDLLAPAARHLGEMWEDDACDFVDVTLAVGRLQAVTRELCARRERGGAGDGRSVLLLPCPGETHTYCLSLVASFFREDGWAVTTAGADPGVDLVELARAEWFDVIGLTLSRDELVPAMTEAVRRMRGASRNRAVRILVGGPLFARHPEHLRAVGADATAADGRTAPLVAQSLLENRARAC